MIEFEHGNLLEANVDALVNTVNTVGVMGKGIALMFKERFPENFRAYAAACKRGDVRLGEMFVTENIELGGPQWIVNFPTKDHWRSRTRLVWIEQGMEDLRRVIESHGIRSIAVPPLGCGNGGLDWVVVKPVIESALARIDGLHATVYEPTERYQNVTKKRGVEELTPARAMVAEMVRRYCILGLGCSVLEVQKLAWFIGRGARQTGVDDPLNLEFRANIYGPYSDRLRFLLDALDGSYLRCERRLSDAKPESEIWFNIEKKHYVDSYMRSLGKSYLPALAWATDTIRGFESPLGMEVLSTVDWLLQRGGRRATVDDVWDGIRHWGRGQQRKTRIFDDRLVDLALERLATRQQG
ncbi:MAG: macro domain-containing protein [Gammaproteobacteria bacterium]|nr:macro domain-containing protein [Gammaproteobacteria bacterium]